MIQVNSELTKSRNPNEHGFDIINEKGSIVHRLDDGFNLIQFNQFEIKEQVKVNKVKKWMLVPLQWYIHDEDLVIKKGG